MQSALDAFGAVDVVVNNAGQVRMAPFATFPDELIDPVIDTQLRGVLNVSRPAWKAMAAHGGGRFVNVASGAAFGGVPGGAVYGMAKMGVIGLTRAMASEGQSRRHRRERDRALGQDASRHRLRADPLERRARRVVAPPPGRAARRAGSRIPSCPLSGECLDVGGGHFARVGLVTNDGILDRDATIETLAARADELTGGPTTPMESAGGGMAAIFRDYPGPTVTIGHPLPDRACPRAARRGAPRTASPNRVTARAASASRK